MAPVSAPRVDREEDDFVQPPVPGDTVAAQLPVPVAPSPTRIQGLDSVIFPRHSSGPLCSFESKAAPVNWLLRRAIQAVWPHSLTEAGLYSYGMGDNIYWRQEVDTSLLQSWRAREVVGDRQTFSLATFIDWEGMKNFGNSFNKGPSKEAFKCPVKFWTYFKIVIIEHHAILCGVNVNGGFSLRYMGF